MSKQRAVKRREQSGLTQPQRRGIDYHLDRTLEAYSRFGENVAWLGAGTIPGAMFGAGLYAVTLDRKWRNDWAPWIDENIELARDIEEAARLIAGIKDSRQLEEIRIAEFLTEYYAGVKPINAQEEALLSEFLETIAKFQTPEWQKDVLLNEVGYYSFTGADLIVDFLDESGMWKTKDLEKACQYSAGTYIEDTLADIGVKIKICSDNDDGALCYNISKASKDAIGLDICDDADRELAKDYYGALHLLHENIEESMKARRDLTLEIDAYQQANEMSGKEAHGIYALDIQNSGGLDVLLNGENSQLLSKEESQLIEMKHSLAALDTIIIDSTNKYEATQETYGEIIKLSKKDLKDLKTVTGRDYSAELEQLHKETQEMSRELQRFADEKVSVYTGIQYEFEEKSLTGEYEALVGDSIQEEGTAIMGTASGLLGMMAGMFAVNNLIRRPIRRKYRMGMTRFLLIEGPASTINAIGETIALAADSAYGALKEFYTTLNTPDQPGE